MPAKFARPIARSPASDPQQFRVYRMEHEAIGGRHYARLSRTAVVALVRGICRNYGVKPPKVGWEDIGRWAAEWREHPSDGEPMIVFSTKKRTARDILTVTHEVAHHLHYELSEGKWEDQENHGPEFMACHMSVLDTIRMIPVCAMRVICDKWKVRYTDPGSTSSLAKLKRIVRGSHRPKH